MSPKKPAKPTIDERGLCGFWIHADDEDEPDRLVFRTASHVFPPRRKPREALKLDAGGVAEAGLPGPADRNIRERESWSLEGDRLTISGSTPLSGRFQVIAVDEESLVLRRCDQEG